MPRKRFATEEIISKLREVELARGKKVPQVCKQLGVSEQTYYCWREEYGSMAAQERHVITEHTLAGRKAKAEKGGSAGALRPMDTVPMALVASQSMLTKPTSS